MSNRLRARRPGHDSVDPWDQSPGQSRRAATLRWLLPLCLALTVAAIAAALWLRLPDAPPLEALVGLALLVPAVLLPAHVLGRQRRRMRNTLRRFSDELDPEHWRDAVRQLREDRLGAPSAFDALASGVETVLGESERRWQALAELSADWFWETDRQHRLSWLSGAAPQALAPGLDESVLLGRRHRPDRPVPRARAGLGRAAWPHDAARSLPRRGIPGGLAGPAAALDLDQRTPAPQRAGHGDRLRRRGPRRERAAPGARAAAGQRAALVDDGPAGRRLVLADRCRAPAAAAGRRAAAAHRCRDERARRRPHPLGRAPRIAERAAMGRAPRRPGRASALPLAAARDRRRRRTLAVDLAQRPAAPRRRRPLPRLSRRGPRHHLAPAGAGAAAAPQRGAAARGGRTHARPAAAEPGPGRLRAAAGPRAAHPHRPCAGPGPAAGRTRRAAPAGRRPGTAAVAGACGRTHARDGRRAAGAGPLHAAADAAGSAGPERAGPRGGERTAVDWSGARRCAGTSSWTCASPPIRRR